MVEAKRRNTDKEEAFLQRQMRAETIKRANDKLYEQTGKMKLLRSNLLFAEVIEVRLNGEYLCVTGLLLLQVAPFIGCRTGVKPRKEIQENAEQLRNCPLSIHLDAVWQRNGNHP